MPNDGNTLADQLEQTNSLLNNIGVKPTTEVVDLGFRGIPVFAPVIRGCDGADMHQVAIQLANEY